MRCAFLGALVVPAVLGCDLGTSAGEVSGSTRSEGAVTTEPAPGVTAATPPEAALVYTAVLKRALKDAWAGRGESGFQVVFVVDGAVPRAAKPTRMEDPSHPFAADLKSGMRFLGEQAELPPIEFVAERAGPSEGEAPGDTQPR